MGRSDYDGTMNAGYVFLGVILILSLLWVGGYIKVGGCCRSTVGSGWPPCSRWWR